MGKSRVSTGAGPGELLERAGHLSALGASLDAVVGDARGRIALVGGEAGVGKTTLLRRFCDEQDRSVRILWGAIYAGDRAAESALLSGFFFPRALSMNAVSDIYVGSCSAFADSILRSRTKRRTERRRPTFGPP